VHLARGSWDDAVRHAHRAADLDRGSHDARDLSQRADAALKQSKMKDFFRTLVLPSHADDGAIKRAYRPAARQWHPDMAKSDDERTAFELKFRDIAEAYDVLSDADKRARYDRGEDVSQPQQNQQQHGFPGGFHFPGGFPHGFPGGGGGFHFRQG
jgi:DnaJ family protein C protein 3